MCQTGCEGAIAVPMRRGFHMRILLVGGFCPCPVVFAERVDVSSLRSGQVNFRPSEPHQAEVSASRTASPSRAPFRSIGAGVASAIRPRRYIHGCSASTRPVGLVLRAADGDRQGFRGAQMVVHTQAPPLRPSTRSALRNGSGIHLQQSGTVFNQTSATRRPIAPSQEPPSWAHMHHPDGACWSIRPNVGGCATGSVLVKALRVKQYQGKSRRGWWRGNSAR